MRIRPITDTDAREWLRLSSALFPGHPVEEHEADLRRVRGRPDATFLVLERPDGSLGGYVEVGTRAYADGCETSPVGYIEAWYIDPDLRRGGHGRALLAAAEEWARARGYREMASDALLDNTVSHEAHRRSGYIEVDRVMQFMKPLVDATKHRQLTEHASGTFTVRLVPQPADDDPATAMLGRMTIDKQFHGDLEATSKGQMLSAMTATAGSAGYVAIERVTGTLHGRGGSFVLLHRGTMHRGTQELLVSVVPDSATGDLVGLSGAMMIEVSGGRHAYIFDYAITGPAAT